ncbi:hypothetical protein [Agarivorans sp. QJM3NY_33]|uniref:hypothetical protein n=1 Tax=Agarivorans sp. QJM3NY_33 TaxID=3421432 RepID=UPI003D7EB856
MVRVNKTFCGSDPSWANACVGTNGNPGYKEYSKGFSRAARVLIDKVLEEDSIEYHIDDFIYPICFNMRHSVELRLKHAIQMLESLAPYKGQTSQFNFSGSHDIKNIWCYFKRKSEIFDIRYSEINNRIEPVIMDIADIDPTGQTFRYPKDNNNIKHLTNTQLINFFTLRSSFTTLEKDLDLLVEMNEFLIREYSLGSFTKKLSRAELFDISKKLPNRDLWKNDDFKDIRDNIKKDYSLSGKDFEKAANIISHNYEMSPMINISIDLLGVSVNDIKTFIKIWFDRHERSISKMQGKKPANDLMEEVSHSINASHESWSSAKEFVTPEIMAGLVSLFYFSYDLEFSELYVERYYNELKLSEAYFLNVRKIKINFHDLVSKTNALENIVASLYFLGFLDDAESIVTDYDFLNQSPVVKKARSRQLFVKNPAFGY